MPRADRTKTTGRRAEVSRRADLPDQLRERIARSGLTAYALGKAADVDPGVIARFLSGERDVRLETAGRIAAALGLSLVEVRVKRGRPAKYPTGDNGEP